MRGINKAIIVGYLGNDPDMKYTAGGTAIANISVATSEEWTDKQTGEINKRTEWHRIVFFNRLAEIAGEYLKKGSLVYIEGKLQTRKWEDKDHITRYTTEIVGGELQMLGGKQTSQRAEQQAEQQAPAKAPERATQQAPVQEDGFADDDIPFN